MILLSSNISPARKIPVKERKCPGDRIPDIHSFIYSPSKSFGERKCKPASRAVSSFLR